MHIEYESVFVPRMPFVCSECGSLVTSPKKHTEWHERMHNAYIHVPKNKRGRT